MFSSKWPKNPTFFSQNQLKTMNPNIIIQSQLTPQTMTSLEIAELTGKQHKDLMRAIRKMEPAWEKVNGRKFALVEYRDKKGELRPCYQLTKTECLYIATKFNDEARAKLVLRWQELELAEQERRQQQSRQQYPLPHVFSSLALMCPSLLRPPGSRGCPVPSSALIPGESEESFSLLFRSR